MVHVLVLMLLLMMTMMKVVVQPWLLVQFLFVQLFGTDRSGVFAP